MIRFLREFMNSLRTPYPILTHTDVVYSWRRLFPILTTRPMEMKKMTTVTAISEIDRGLADSSTNSTTLIQQSIKHWTAGLFVSAVLGGVSGLGGLTLGFLTIGELIAPSMGLYMTGTVLLGASFLLFGLAAHCLDKADAADKAIRLEYCRQHGLKD
jgi:hypothetical protein